MSAPTGRRIGGVGLAIAVGLTIAFGTGVPARSSVVDPVSDVALAGSRIEPVHEVDAGPVAAMRMVDRLQLFQTGNAGTRIELDAAELTALLRHAIPGILPTGVSDPTIQIRGSEVRVRARVAPRALPGGTHLGGVLAVVPDAVDVELRGHLSRPSFGMVEYRVEGAEVEGVALPSGVIGLLVQSWPGGVETRSDGEGAPVIRARWPIAGGRFRVQDDVLIIDRPEPLLLESVDGSGGA